MTDDKETIKSRARSLRARVRADLAARGITDDDLAAVEQDIIAQAGAVLGWTFTVELTGGREPLKYELENSPGATLFCNGEAVLEA